MPGTVRARQHCYGRAAFGDPKGVSHAASCGRSPLASWSVEDAFASGFQNGEGIDGAMKGHPDTKADSGVWAEGMPDYSVQVGGILPGYAGHVPRSIHKFGASAKGNTPQFDKSAEHREVEELRQLFSRAHGRDDSRGRRSPARGSERRRRGLVAQGAPSGAIEGQMTDFRDQINGVLPKVRGPHPARQGQVRRVALRQDAHRRHGAGLAASD